MDITILITFIFGYLSSLLIEKVKKDLESIPIIDLFRKDFKLSWQNLDSAKSMPNNDVFSAGTFVYRGIDDLSISGVDTYLILPIHNFNLFEIEGPKLAKHLRKSGRDRFWQIFLLSKDIETLRVKLLNKELGENDNEYREIVRKLIAALYKQLRDFEKDLVAAYPLIVRCIRHFQS